MVEELKLSGAKLSTYAIIYGFSKNGKWYTGNREYLANWSTVKIRQIQNILNDLVKEELLEKKTYGTHVWYRAKRA